MTIDLSTASPRVMMRAAYALTHQIEREQDGAILADLRAQRDTIENEVVRRSEAVERALVAVEAAERVMRGVNETLSGVHLSAHDKNGAAAITEAREALTLMMDRTTTTTCSLVKDQSLSDRIAKAAIAIVRPIVTRSREAGARMRVS